MKRKITLVFSMFVLFLILVVPKTYASSSDVIDSEKAWRYECTVIKKGTTYSWKIGHRGDTFVIKENEDNVKLLTDFRNAISKIKRENIRLLLSSAYFLIVGLTVLFVYLKNKKLKKNGVIIIALFAVFALYTMFDTALDLNTSLDDAKSYFLTLTK